jgi:hypothetical protein
MARAQQPEVAGAKRQHRGQPRAVLLVAMGHDDDGIALRDVEVVERSLRG